MKEPVVRIRLTLCALAILALPFAFSSCISQRQTGGWSYGPSFVDSPVWSRNIAVYCVKEVSLAEAMSTLEALANENQREKVSILVSDDVAAWSRPVTLCLRNVPLIEAPKYIASSLGAAVITKGNMAVLVARSPGDGYGELIICGKCLDAGTGRPIRRFNVETRFERDWTETNLLCVADFEGRYGCKVRVYGTDGVHDVIVHGHRLGFSREFRPMPQGMQVTVSARGYAPNAQEVSLTETSRILTLNINLAPEKRKP